MQKLKLSLKENSYEILIGSGILEDSVKGLKKIAHQYIIITDSVVYKKFGKKLLALLKKNKIKFFFFFFKSGEKSKNFDNYQSLIKKLFRLGVDRKSGVIALGGGVVGDLAGFVAATYMRGIPYVQIPTTLLAMVDSSIGGKVAIDIENAKNLCGAFYQPKKVIIDVDFLKTLPEKEMNNGLAEIVKYGIIMDKKLFYFIEKNLGRIKKKKKKVLLKIITDSCRIKAKIVELDEKEKNIRSLLNYGHTVGHAIEALSGYKCTHGEAVSIGIAVAAKVSYESKILKKNEMEAQINLLKKIGLPTKIPKEFKTKEIMGIIRKDKKNFAGKMRCILAKKIGHAIIKKNIDETIIKKALLK